MVRIARWSIEDECFVAFAPRLPGITAFGATADEALDELDIALGLAERVLREDS